MDASDPRFPVVQQLMKYWLEHPRAADTLDGIHRWWLAGTPASSELLEDALEWLVSRGVVVTYTTSDGRKHYRYATVPDARPS